MHTAEYYEKGIEKLFWIVNKDMESVPFTLKPAQKRMLQEMGKMDIILKARQEGISSLILAMFALDFITVENIRCVVISHEEKATKRLFDRVKYYLESVKKNWPGSELPYSLEIKSRSELYNSKMNSYFYIGTAGARAFGHGDTINNLHCSELSRWADQENMMVGLLQAVPKDGRVIIETTANGMGDYFYKLWMRSKGNAASWLTHFIPWFEEKDYVMPASSLGEPTEDELLLMNQYHLSLEQIAWRRWKIDQLNGNIDKFNEQFPSTAEEAFIVSGNPVWSPSILKWYLVHCQNPVMIGNLIGYDPVSIERNEKGYLKIFKQPQEFHQYVIGADVAEGKVVSEMEGGKERDASVAQVIDRRTLEQVAIWHGQVSPDILGMQLELLGRYYNNAFIAVERNSVGMVTVMKLRDLNYPYLYYREKFGLITEKRTAELGWVTDRMTKDLMISDASRMFRDKRLTIYDEETVGEMMSYVYDADGHANAAKSAHDDRVMSLLIAIQMLSRGQSRQYENDIERSDNNFLQSGGFTMGGVTFDKNGMPANPDEFDISDSPGF